MSVISELESLFDDIVEVMNKKAGEQIAEHAGRILMIEIVDLGFRYAIMATTKGAVTVEPDRIKPTGRAKMYFDTFRALFEGQLTPKDAMMYGFVVFESDTPIADFIMIDTFLNSIGGAKGLRN